MPKFDLEIDGKISSTTLGNVDKYYGGGNEAWASLAAAKAGVPPSLRSGKTVGVVETGKVVEYIWHPDDITDNGLVLKTSDSGDAVVVNNTTTSTSTTEAASANVAKQLKDSIDALSAVLNADDVALDTAQERIDYIKNLSAELEGLQISDILNLQTALDNKVAQVSGKGLSKNDFTDDYKAKIDNEGRLYEINIADTFYPLSSIHGSNSTIKVLSATDPTTGIQLSNGMLFNLSTFSFSIENHGTTSVRFWLHSATYPNLVNLVAGEQFIPAGEIWKFSYDGAILTCIKSNIFTDSLKIKLEEASNYPKPYFNNLSPLSVSPTQSRTITINGAFFKEPVENMLARFVRYSEAPLVDANGLPIHDETKVIRELQVNSLTFVNDSVMEVNVTGVNIHDTATHGTDAYELDGTTEINNVYWLLLHNGATRIFQNAFTVSSGDIYIPRAGLTTDVPEGSWSLVSGFVQFNNNGNISISGESVSGVADVDDVTIPDGVDFEVSYKHKLSEYDPSPGDNAYTHSMILIDDLDNYVWSIGYYYNPTTWHYAITSSNGAGSTAVIKSVTNDTNYSTISDSTYQIRRTSGVTSFYVDNVLQETSLTTHTGTLNLRLNLKDIDYTDIFIKILP